MFNRILILRGVIEIGNSDVGRLKKNVMVIDYHTVLSPDDFFRNFHSYYISFVFKIFSLVFTIFKFLISSQFSFSLHDLIF